MDTSPHRPPHHLLEMNPKLYYVDFYPLHYHFHYLNRINSISSRAIGYHRCMDLHYVANTCHYVVKIVFYKLQLFSYLD